MDGRCHLRRVVQFREGVPPRAIDPQMPFDILYQMPHALAGMVAGALVMDIAEGSFNGIGLRTVGGQVEQLKARMGGQPFGTCSAW